MTTSRESTVWRSSTSRYGSRVVAVVLAATVCLGSTVAMAATYTWGNLTPNGSLSGTNGYSFTSGANWVGGAPTFDNQAELVFTGLDSGTATTTWGGFVTTTMNRITVNTASTLRFNSADSTFSFPGTSPTLDIEAGTLRMEVKVASGTAGLTKTGTGVLFSNLQSASAGFTGPFTIAQGLLTSGNSYALGDAKTVNILTGAGANMSGQKWAAADMGGGGSPVRFYAFNISGSGVDGLGAIYNSGVEVVGTYSGIQTLNLTANASVGGTGDFAIANFGSISGSGVTLTKVGTNKIWIGSGATTGVSFHVAEGTLVGNLADNALGDATGFVSVAGGATLASNNNRRFANALEFADGATLTNLLNSGTWTGNATLTSGTTTVTGASASTPITMSGVISGSGGITKTGANTLILSNTNTYTGVTFISSGTVRLAPTGSIDNSSTIRVASGASLDVSPAADYSLAAQILTGAGTVIGDLAFANGSTVRPGNSPGTLTVTGTVTWNAGGNYDWQVFDATGTAGGTTGWDLLTVGGALDLTNLSSSNRFNINLWSLSGISPDSNGLALNFDPNASGSWTILSAAAGISGFSSDLFQINVDPFNGTGGFANSLSPGWGFSMQQDGNNLNLVYSVPEPSTYAMALAGIACGGYSMWRRRKRA